MSLASKKRTENACKSKRKVMMEMKDLRINFKETCAIREIELIFSAMEKAAKFGNYKAVLSFSKLLQKRLKQCEDFCFVQSEQQTGQPPYSG